MQFWTPKLIKKTCSFPDTILQDLQNAKLIILLLQFGDKFSTDHELLDKIDGLKIMLVNRNMYEKPTEAFFQHYDLAIFYNGPTYEDAVTGNDGYISDPTNEICVKEMYDATTEVLERYILPNLSKGSRLHLTTKEEELIMQVSFLNRKYGLRGIQPDFAKNFVSKVDMIERAKNVKNTAPLSFLFKLDRTQEPEEIAKKLINMGLPGFPLFGKPVAASDAAGAQKIHNTAELIDWLRKAIASPLGYENFLIQEFLEGTFYITETFVSSDGTFHFLCVATSINSWSGMISDVIPASNVYLTEDVEVYRKLKTFSEDFLQEFGARSHPGIYIIEVIQNPTGHFKLLETYCRPDGGANENRLTEMIIGVDTEAVHIVAPFVDDIFFIKSATRNQILGTKSGFSVWYPRKKGVVVENRAIDLELPKGAKIAMTKYYFKPGDIVDKNLEFSSELRCEAFVLTNSFEDSYKTAKKFLEFDPVVMDEAKTDAV